MLNIVLLILLAAMLVNVLISLKLAIAQMLLSGLQATTINHRSAFSFAALYLRTYSHCIPHFAVHFGAKLVIVSMIMLSRIVDHLPFSAVRVYHSVSLGKAQHGRI